MRAGMRAFDTHLLKRLVIQLGGVIAVAVILAGFLVAYNSTYSMVVTLDRKADEGWDGITHDLVERYQGIPGLLASIRPTLGPDTAALDEVERNLSRWNNALRGGEIDALNPETANLEAALSRLAADLEGRPETWQSLGVVLFLYELSDSGAAIEADRAAYNEAVRDYNEAISTFPATLWSENWGYVPRAPFTAEIRAGGRPPAAPA